MNDTRAAKVVFTQDVHPIVARCGGGSCHDIGAVSGAQSKFYNTDPEMAYPATTAATSLVGTFSSIAPILTHIQAGHKNITYTPGETTQITNWLAKESAERNGQPPPNQPPAFDPKEALKTWSGCMSLDNFKTANMTLAWSNLAASNLQKCIGCHQGGVSGFLIINDATKYFDALSTTTAFLLKYFTVDTTAKKVIVNQSSFKSAAMISGHPTFDPINNAGMTALVKFYDLTAARQTANQCDPGRLKD